MPKGKGSMYSEVPYPAGGGGGGGAAQCGPMHHG